MDKPLECSSCRNPCSVTYNKLLSDLLVQESFCSDCPLLNQRLIGITTQHESHVNTDVSCQECGTTLQELLRHEPLGCAHCYSVFEKAICQRLKIDHLDYKQDIMINKNINPTSDQLLKLSTDLQEAVSQENFEKAAVLRDEINKLKKMMSPSHE